MAAYASIFYLKQLVRPTCHSSCHNGHLPTRHTYESVLSRRFSRCFVQNYTVKSRQASVWNKPGGVGCRWNATLLIILRGCDSGNFLGVHYPTLPPTVHLESWNPNHSTCLVLDCLVLKWNASELRFGRVHLFCRKRKGELLQEYLKLLIPESFATIVFLGFQTKARFLPSICLLYSINSWIVLVAKRHW